MQMLITFLGVMAGTLYGLEPAQWFGSAIMVSAVWLPRNWKVLVPLVMCGALITVFF